uniref:Xylanolytic transcriptional activator regulatory domain-containing protein n=1 Tax=Bionectria ochroleuca TaxID=29856 RepID=A0A0B7KG76_BIOOC
MSAMLNGPQPQPEASQQEHSSTIGVLDDEDQDYDDTAVHDESFGQAGERHGPDGNPTESFAVKCDRVYPCSHCVKTSVQCVFLSNQKRRIKRQRVHISDIYENKIDQIALRIEELNRTISQLSLAQPQPDKTTSGSTNQTAQHASHMNSSPGLVNNTPSSGVTSAYEEKQTPPTQPEFEGESSLSAHATFATKFLQSCVSNSPSSKVMLEMTSVLDTLKAIVDSQKQKADTLDTLYPNARPLPAGASLRQLPPLSIEHALAALRMVQENSRIRALWLMDVQTLSQFTGHFIKVCSPGPATEADLIIVYAGFYWLFEECSKETLYCLEKCKPSAAWAFICTASQQSQALGLHSMIAWHTETMESKQYRMRLFWTIYTVEKTLAFRLGRSSTIRDNDISIPRISNDASSEYGIDDTFSFWIELSSLQGRVYDEVYSPISLTQPEEIRSARARGLATQARGLLQAQDHLQRQNHAIRSELMGAGLSELLWRADRVTALSMLTLIYRSIPPEDASKSVFCTECLSAAKEALIEHEKCVAILTDKEFQPDMLELYVNWALLQSPFTPFIVLFCHIIETSDPSDLECLKRLVEILEIAASTPKNVICERQLRLFKALYEVAIKYFDIKAQTTQAEHGGHGADGLGGPYLDAASGGLLQHQSTAILGSGSLLGPGSEITYGPVEDPISNLGNNNVNQVPGQQRVMPGARVGHFNPQGPGATRMEMEQSGAGLATWFYLNDQMIRMLGES